MLETYQVPGTSSPVPGAWYSVSGVCHVKSVTAAAPKWCPEYTIFSFFLKFILILFLRDDCGPIETIKNVYFVSVSKYHKICSSPGYASARQEMEDAQVGDRELQATTDRNKGTRTTATTIEVDSGCLRAARIAWSEKK